QPAASPQQGADQQQQGDEQPGPVEQAGTQFAHAGAPGHGRQLALEQRRHLLQPGQVQRLVAGNPEHLLVEGGAQAADGVLQLLLVELQGDGLVEQGVELAAHALQQFAAGGGQLQQGAAQLGTDLLGGLVGGLVGEQAVDVVLQVAQLFALLVEFELVETDVGDLVGQVAVQLQPGQAFLLLVEDARQQQAAAQHVDLLVQGLVGLVDAVQLLLGLQVLPGQLVEPLGGAQQVVG